MDMYSEELEFSNVFMGSGIDPRIVKLKYSIPKQLNQSCEEVTEEWPAARSVDNIFFKLKKVQMQAVTGQVSVAVFKQKTGGKIITAGRLRDQLRDLEKLI
jgi:hypothetical protein